MYLIFALIILTTLIGFSNDFMHSNLAGLIILLVLAAIFLQKRKKLKKPEINQIVPSQTYSDQDLQKNYIDQIDDLIIVINSFNIITFANMAAKKFYSSNISL